MLSGADGAAPFIPPPILIIGSSTVVVVLFTVVVVPLTVKLPVTTKLPPTFAFLAMPTPPDTINAPLLVLELSVVFVTLVTPVTPSVPFNCVAFEIVNALAVKVVPSNVKLELSASKPPVVAKVTRPLVNPLLVNVAVVTPVTVKLVVVSVLVPELNVKFVLSASCPPVVAKVTRPLVKLVSFKCAP